MVKSLYKGLYFPRAGASILPMSSSTLRRKTRTELATRLWELGIEQRALAAFVGVSEGQMSRYVNGKINKIPADKLAKIEQGIEVLSHA